MPPGLDAQISTIGVGGPVGRRWNWIANTITAERAGGGGGGRRRATPPPSAAGAVALGLGSQGASVAVGASLSYNYVGGAPLGISRSHSVKALIRDTEGLVSGGHVQVSSRFEGRDQQHHRRRAWPWAPWRWRWAAPCPSTGSSRNEAGIRNARQIESRATGGSLAGVAVSATTAMCWPWPAGWAWRCRRAAARASRPGSRRPTTGSATRRWPTSTAPARPMRAPPPWCARRPALRSMRSAIRASSPSPSAWRRRWPRAGFAGAGAGAGSGNTIEGSVEARLTRVDTPSGGTLNQGAVRVSAANTGSIVTVAGALGVAVSAGSAGVGASIGVSVAISSIATTVRARWRIPSCAWPMPASPSGQRRGHHGDRHRRRGRGAGRRGRRGHRGRHQRRGQQGIQHGRGHGLGRSHRDGRRQADAQRHSRRISCRWSWAHPSRCRRATANAAIGGGGALALQ